MGKESKESTFIGPHTRKYGKPQGNELVFGKEIIRRTGILKYSVIDRFINDKDANRIFQEWMKENNITWNHRYTKLLNHAMLRKLFNN